MGNLCDNSDDSGIWKLSETIRAFESAPFRRARDIAVAVVRSKRYFDQFARIFDKFSVDYEEFRGYVDAKPFQLLKSSNNSNYRSSNRSTTNESQGILNSVVSRSSLLSREICLNENILRILARDREYKQASDQDIIHSIFIVAATLVNEMSHILNFILNGTPPGAAGSEFGEAMEIGIFGEVCWMHLREPFLDNSVNVTLVSKSGQFEIINVTSAMLDAKQDTPEVVVELETRSLVRACDVRNCTVNRRECDFVESPSESKSVLIS